MPPLIEQNRQGNRTETIRIGAIAQLEERNTGSVEVGGSSPPGSTILGIGKRGLPHLERSPIPRPAPPPAGINYGQAGFFVPENGHDGLLPSRPPAKTG